MKTFKLFITEKNDPSQHGVLAFGRMNPPTIGHAKLIDKVLSIPGRHHIVVSGTQDKKKNPLSGEKLVR